MNTRVPAAATRLGVNARSTPGARYVFRGEQLLTCSANPQHAHLIADDREDRSKYTTFAGAIEILPKFEWG